MTGELGATCTVNANFSNTGSRIKGDVINAFCISIVEIAEFEPICMLESRFAMLEPFTLLATWIRTSLSYRNGRVNNHSAAKQKNINAMMVMSRLSSYSKTVLSKINFQMMGLTVFKIHIIPLRSSIIHQCRCKPNGLNGWQYLI